MYLAQQREDWNAVWAMFPPYPDADPDVTAANLAKWGRKFKIPTITGIRRDDIPEEFPKATSAAAVEMDIRFERFAQAPRTERGAIDYWVLIDDEWYWSGPAM